MPTSQMIPNDPLPNSSFEVGGLRVNSPILPLDIKLAQ